MRYLENENLEMTNNRAERAIKPFVIGRKNRLFCNTPSGAVASALLYSVIETAKVNNLKIYDYIVCLASRQKNFYHGAIKFLTISENIKRCRSASFS